MNCRKRKEQHRSMESKSAVRRHLVCDHFGHVGISVPVIGLTMLPFAFVAISPLSFPILAQLPVTRCGPLASVGVGMGAGSISDRHAGGTHVIAGHDGSLAASIFEGFDGGWGRAEPAGDCGERAEVGGVHDRRADVAVKGAKHVGCPVESCHNRCDGKGGRAGPRLCGQWWRM
jgi:hypothetical protein